jgi:two-component system, sensor histidine kinase and response regulator
MDGYQATAKLRSDERFSTLKIIAMTAHATIEERQRCLAAGMNDHISKPIDPANLFETVGRYWKPAPSAAPSEPGAGFSPLQPLPQHGSANSPAVPTTGELPIVAGLDTKDGLSRVAGNRKLYLKLLRQFIDQQGPAAVQITDALARNDAELAERLAHTVKGVAGNLGARAVQQAAARLEKAIATKSPAAELTPVLNQFSSLLDDFSNRLRDALPPMETPAPTTAAAAPVDPEQTKRVLLEMIAHLNNFDPEASECFETHRDVFRSLLTEEKFAVFKQQVVGFAFAEALAQLQPVAKERGLLPA